MKIDCHMHTPLCGHARGDPAEFVRAAAAQGIGLVTFTCHIPMAEARFGGPRIRMDEDKLPEYFDLVGEGAALGLELGVEVLCGIEAEIFPDEEELGGMDELLAAHSFDVVLGSLHHQLSAYKRWLIANDVEGDHAVLDVYFRQLAEAARSGRYHSIAHPDVIRIYGTVDRFEPAEHEPVIRDFLAAVLEAGICIEVNTSGLIKGVYQVHPDPLILDWAAEMGVPLTIGSDAHHPSQVGQEFGQVLPMLREKGFKQLHYHRGGERVAVAL